MLQLGIASREILAHIARLSAVIDQMGAQLLPQTQCAHSVPKSFKCILRLFQNNPTYLERLAEPCSPTERLHF